MSQMTDEFVKIRNVAKNYGDKVILHDVNLSIQNHEFIALVGKVVVGKVPSSD